MEILDTKPPSEEEGGAGADMQDEMLRRGGTDRDGNESSVDLDDPAAAPNRLQTGAARMVEQMERENIVMPADGAKPREGQTSRRQLVA